MHAELFAKNVALQALIEKLRAIVGPDAQLHMDSRTLKAGDVFVACPGLVGDARTYVEAAIQAGAAAIVLHVENIREWQDRSTPIPMFGVENLKARVGEFADSWYSQPSTDLCVVAVTGTNG